MKYTLKYSITLFLFFSLFCCTQHTKQTPITYLEKKYQVRITPHIKKIYLVDENKISCGPCLNEFLHYLTQKQPTQQELILLNNTGTFINHNLFQNKACTIIQYKPKLNALDSLLPSLGIIYVTNGTLDSVVHVTPTNIQQVIAQDG
ncbi:hypothetical protein [Myroides sp. WP-1]|uniref:hypothetical protein n=1 Tax=Myroides sp. WP-1 TaxID=2759944 RepID=UPI0015FA67C0|nr:hypothetical protein [Myroides sp. WP-1]MBB1140551.1 hypothetical protein [Myroides sp. WP-1]